MTVAEMERRFYELKGKIDVGAIGDGEFRIEIEKLRFQDSQNRWWMIGAQSGRWYYYDGERWIPGKPPEVPEEPTTFYPPQPPPAASPITPPPIPKPISQATPTAPYPAMTAPVRPSARPLVTRVETPAVAPALPVLDLRSRLPIIMGCAALVALGLCIALVLAVENIVPGRPLSSAAVSFMPKSGPTATPGAKNVASFTMVATRVSTQPPSIAGDTISSFLAVGDDLLLKSLYDAAVTQYQNAAQLAPSSAAPLTRWSYALSLRGQLQDALARAQQAVQRAPNDADALAQLARVQTWLKQTDQAIANGQKAVISDGKNATAHAVLAVAYLSGLKTNEAQKEAQAAVTLAPSSAEAHRALAWANLILGQREAAMTEWNQVVALEPNLAWRHFEYAEVLRIYARDPANAAAEYMRAIELYGGYVPAYGRLGMALVDQNQPQAAIPQLRRAITLERANAANHAYLGIAYGMSGQCTQAIPYFEQALRMDASNATATKGLADCQAGGPVSAPAPIAPAVPLLPPSFSTAQ